MPPIVVAEYVDVVASSILNCSLVSIERRISVELAHAFVYELGYWAMDKMLFRCQSHLLGFNKRRELTFSESASDITPDGLDSLQNTFCVISGIADLKAEMERWPRDDNELAML